MADYMDYTCGVTGMVKLKDEQVKTVIANVKKETEQAILAGYKYFWLALTGTASLHYAAGIREAARSRNGIVLELMVPFPEWSKGRLLPEQYKQITQNSNGLQFATKLPVEDSIMLTNNRVLDLATRMIVVSDGKDEEAKSIIEIANEIEIPVSVIEP